MKLRSLALGALALSTVSANAACPTWSDNLGLKNNKEECGLNDSAAYSGNLLLTSDKRWVLQGGVFIGGDNKDKGSITIEPGTTIVGNSGADYLVISRGSQIFAEGTSTAPIVFTTANEGNSSRGQWGGLVINGNAPINVAGGEATGEGATGVYGGNDSADNSGVLKYVRVEYAGFEITPDNELNGISFQGVGSGTTVDYIQVHKNSDDGVEFFGGTVDVKHVLLTGNRDDSMDWTSGWRGRAQFVIIDQFDDAANNAIEADNLSKDMYATPRSNPILSNFTILATKGTSAKGGSAILLRKGSAVDFQNSILIGGKKGCIDFDDEATTAQGDIHFIGNFLHCDIAFEAESQETANVADYFTAENYNEMMDPMLSGFAPSDHSPVVALGDVTPFGKARYGTFFDSVDFAGAVKDSTDSWFKGWTNLTRD